MRKLVITQTKENNAKEAVPTAVINKLYTIGKLDDTNHTFTYGVDTSNVKRPITTVSGAIIIPVAYMGRLEYVRAKYPNLDITANAIYIDFEDSNVELKLLNAGIGDGTGITVEDASTTSLLAGNFFKDDTSIQRFNEFKYFTKANTSTTGLVGLFLNATSLTQIDLSELVVLHKDEFRNTRITTINAPKLSILGANLAGANAFSNNPSLLTVQSLGTISEIPRACFVECTNLQSAIIPDDCIILNGDAFKSDSSLTTLLINNPLNIIQIGTSCFNGCSNLELDITNFTSVQTLGDYCFQNCSNVTGIINMPNYSASRFTGFGRAKISKALCMGIASLVDGISSNSEANARLTEVYLPYECTNIGAGAFTNLALLNTVKLYSKTVSEWQEGETQTYMSDLSKITFFGNNSFERCRILPLTTADVRNATIIGESAFYLTSISGILDVPNLTDLRKLAFAETHITSITDLGNITAIRLSTFYGCTSLTSVTLPLSVITLESQAFRNCTSLTTINLSNILSFGGAALLNTALTGALDLSGLLGSIGDTTFSGCTGITSITSLGSATSLNPNGGYGTNSGSFYGCTSLTSVTFPSTLTTLGNSVFLGCSNLSLVQGFENLTTIKGDVFRGHAAWEYVVNCSNLVSLGPDSFGNTRLTTRVKQLYLPKITEGAQNSYYSNNTYFRGSFSGMNSDLIYLRDMEVLRPGSFANTTCDSLVINNITPPRWEYYYNPSDESINMKTFANSNITNIYVPDSAVSTYTSDSHWSTLASKIKPLSLLTKVATEADLLQGQIALIEAYM